MSTESEHRPTLDAQDPPERLHEPEAADYADYPEGTADRTETFDPSDSPDSPDSTDPEFDDLVAPRDDVPAEPEPPREDVPAEPEPPRDEFPASAGEDAVQDPTPPDVAPEPTTPAPVPADTGAGAGADDRWRAGSWTTRQRPCRRPRPWSRRRSSSCGGPCRAAIPATPSSCGRRSSATAPCIRP